jgi:hypothetical protein
VLGALSVCGFLLCFAFFASFVWAKFSQVAKAIKSPHSTTILLSNFFLVQQLLIN